MREILFRGKLLAGVSAGEWVYGNLVVKSDNVAIITPDDTPIGRYGRVAPETVGQFTGLHDRNGTRIFEGDILRYSIMGKELWEIRWNAGRAFFGAHNSNVELGAFAFEVGEVIGNIHDNPELLDTPPTSP